MDETRHSSAIILNRSAYRESDSLVTVYTKDYGKMSLVARGTKKIQSKLAGHLEPLNLVDILIIKGKGFDYIGSALATNTFLNIKDNLNKLYFSGRAIYWFNRLIKDDQSDERLFLLLYRWLDVLDNYSSEEFTKENGELYFSFFAFKFLAELGYRPEMHECLSCREKVKPGSNHFNLKNGGLVCTECFEKSRLNNDNGVNELLTISDNCVKIIRFIINENISKNLKLKLDKKLIKELSLITNSFLVYQV